MPKEVKEEKVHEGRKSREFDDGKLSPDGNANEDEVTADLEEEEVEEQQHAAKEEKKGKEKRMR